MTNTTEIPFSGFESFMQQLQAQGRRIASLTMKPRPAHGDATAGNVSAKGRGVGATPRQGVFYDYESIRRLSGIPHR